MTSMWKRAGVTLMVAVAMLLGGCDTLTEPGPQPSIQEPAASSDLLGGLLGGEDDGGLLGTVDGLLDTSVKLVRTVVHVVGSVGEALIGPVGGTLAVDNHEVVVPAGAVSNPTEFSMVVLDGRVIEVDLTATDPETGDDVGGKGFKRPVQLSLSYADARVKKRDIDDLVIVRLHEDGTREVLPSTVNRETQQVTAELDHFSRYALCSN